MTKKDIILNSLRIAKNRTLSIKEFEDVQFGIYHKLASRCSDLNKLGYKIEYIPSSSGVWSDAAYRLVLDKDYDIEQNGQLRFA
jgi:hypothetical protein